MNALNSILVLIAAYLAVYAETSFNGVRSLLGAQIDALPALMVYTGLRCNLAMVTLVSVIGGLCFDSLSANLLGASVPPLFLIGMIIYFRRGLILQDQFYAQFVLGLVASAAAPVLNVLLLLSARQNPLLGWGSLWQWIVLSVGGGLLTPVIFLLFTRLDHALSYRPVIQTSFRPDREIRRSRK